MPITLKSRHFQRSFENTDEGLVTTSFSSAKGTELIAPCNVPEASVTIDGKEFILGGKRANSLPFMRHETDPMPSKEGMRLTLLFAGHHALPAGIEVRAIYDAPDCAPVLIKSIRIDNDSDLGIKIDAIHVESITPTDFPQAALLFESDYVRDAIMVDGQSAYFPWIEYHHYYVRRLLSVVTKRHDFGYPVPVERWLINGQRFSSFRAYEYVLDNRGMEQRGIALRDASRELFPWTNARDLIAQIPFSGKIEDYYTGIASAAEAGFNCIHLWSIFDVGRISSPMFTNFNDYVLNPQLFPNGFDDVRKLTSFAHDKGMKIGFYTIYSQTWQGIYGKGPDAYQRNNWELVWPHNHKESHTEPGLGGPAMGTGARSWHRLGAIH